MNFPHFNQISSVKDISQSSIEGSSGSSNRLRLLRFKLTDGHSEITAIEYARIPSIQDDVIPGTKVLLCSLFTRIIKDYLSWLVALFCGAFLLLSFPFY